MLAAVILMKLLKKLNKVQSKYEQAMTDAKAEIEDKVDFGFSIQWQPSDGWTICADDSSVVPLDAVLKTIKDKGRMSVDDMKELSI